MTDMHTGPFATAELEQAIEKRRHALSPKARYVLGYIDREQYEHEKAAAGRVRLRLVVDNTPQMPRP